MIFHMLSKILNQVIIQKIERIITNFNSKINICKINLMKTYSKLKRNLLLRINKIKKRTNKKI